MVEVAEKNEKCIYLDFAWIGEAENWIETWIEIVLATVVLGARPFFVLHQSA